MLELVTDGMVDIIASGARHGRGLFETIRIRDGRPLFLDRHLERLAGGAAFLEMDAPPEPEAVLGFLLGRSALASVDSGALRLFAVDRKIAISVAPGLPSSPAGARLEVSKLVRRYSGNPANAWKTMSYLDNELLTREAEARGCFELVALNEAGALTDGGRTNVFLVREGRVLTPAASDGALPGVARRVLLECGYAREARLDEADLAACEAVFLVNALRWVVPVAAFAGFPMDTAHPAIAAALRALSEAAGA